MKKDVAEQRKRLVSLMVGLEVLRASSKLTNLKTYTMLTGSQYLGKIKKKLKQEELSAS